VEKKTQLNYSEKHGRVVPQTIPLHRVQKETIRDKTNKQTNQTKQKQKSRPWKVLS
jgi:hypothetical protein